MDLNAGHKETKGDLARFQAEVPQLYARRDEMREDLKEIKDALKDVNELLRGASGNR